MFKKNKAPPKKTKKHTHTHTHTKQTLLKADTEIAHDLDQNQKCPSSNFAVTMLYYTKLEQSRLGQARLDQTRIDQSRLDHSRWLHPTSSSAFKMAAKALVFCVRDLPNHECSIGQCYPIPRLYQPIRDYWGCSTDFRFLSSVSGMKRDTVAKGNLVP